MIQRLATRLGLVLWITCSLLILGATATPFRFTTDDQIVEMKIAHVSPNPFFDPWTGRWVTVSGVALNILLFVPFGALGVTAWRRRIGPDTIPRVMLVTLLGLLLSLAIETAQVFTRTRIPSSADVLANTIGAFAGALSSRLIKGGRLPGRRLASERS